MKPVHKFGFIGDLDTTEKVVSEGSQVNIPYLAAEVVVKISSTDIDDDLGDTGAETVLVSGVDGSFNEVSELVILNGRTEVLTVQKFLRIYRMQVMSAGASGKNEGIIHCGTGDVTTGVPAVKLIQIAAGDNQTLAAFWTSPINARAHLRQITLSGARTTGTVQALVTFRLMVREDGGLWTLKWKHSMVSNTIIIPIPKGAIEFGPGTDFEMRAASGIAATAAGVDFQFELYSTV
jgi:hypothetical protein